MDEAFAQEVSGILKQKQAKEDLDEYEESGWPKAEREEWQQRESHIGTRLATARAAHCSDSSRSGQGTILTRRDQGTTVASTLQEEKLKESARPEATVRARTGEGGARHPENQNPNR